MSPTPTPAPRPILSLAELIDATGETPRTIRYYISQGLLPSPAGFGPGSRYTAGHLDRLRLIRELQREHLPLATIRQRLERLSDDQVRDLLTTGQELPEPRGTAFDYIQSILSGTNRRAFTMPMPPTRPRQSATLTHAQGAGKQTVDPSAAPAQPPAPLAAAPMPAPATSPPAGAAAPAFPPGAARSTVRPAAEQPAVDESATPAPQANPSSSPASTSIHDRSQWERVTLAPDVELHVRRPLSRIQNRRVERLLELARQLLEEDQP